MHTTLLSWAELAVLVMMLLRVIGIEVEALLKLVLAILEILRKFPPARV